MEGVGRVQGNLVLGGGADEALGVREGHIGWDCTVVLVVGEDLDEKMRVKKNRKYYRFFFCV